MMRTEAENDDARVKFEPPLPIRVMAIDGTRSCDGFLTEISDREGEIELTGYAGELSEFFLLLTRFGNPVFRRCWRKWVRGAEMGVSFNRTDIGIRSSKEVPQEKSGV